MPVIPAFPVNDLLVLAFIVSMFVLFMVVLGAVTWWSNRTAAPALAPARAQKAATPTNFRSDVAA